MSVSAMPAPGIVGWKCSWMSATSRRRLSRNILPRNIATNTDRRVSRSTSMTFMSTRHMSTRTSLSSSTLPDDAPPPPDDGVMLPPPCRFSLGVGALHDHDSASTTGCTSRDRSSTSMYPPSSSMRSTSSSTASVRRLRDTSLASKPVRWLR
jgi:hypothetical protein